MNIERFLVSEGSKGDFKKHPTDFTGDYTDKKEAVKHLEKNVSRLAEQKCVIKLQTAAIAERESLAKGKTTEAKLARAAHDLGLKAVLAKHLEVIIPYDKSKRQFGPAKA